MIDHFGRSIDYIRISVTDLCNLRCIYCMPEEGVKKLRHEDILTVEEIEGIAKSAAGLGITKIRLTGGEPLVRRGILDIVSRVAGAPGVSEVSLTTNGTMLANFASQLKDAGLSRVNISVDSFDPETYKMITRGGDVKNVKAGIRAAIDASLTPIKLNVVLMGGINDKQIKPMAALAEEEDIHVRFIEIMPIGECANWNRERFISLSKVLEEEPALEYAGTDGVSDLYKKPGSKGTVGLISPISKSFCLNCNKLRITSDGKVKPCLHSAEEISLRGLNGKALTQALRGSALAKPLKHELQSEPASRSERGMSAIGG